MSLLHVICYPFENVSEVLYTVPDGVYHLYLEKLVSNYKKAGKETGAAMIDALLEYQGPLE